MNFSLGNILGNIVQNSRRGAVLRARRCRNVSKVPKSLYERLVEFVKRFKTRQNGTL